MTSIRPFEAMDVLNFNSTNLDPLTETYELSFYFQYLAKWPDMFIVAQGTDGTIDAYIMGKVEESAPYHARSANFLPWHAHITALTVAPHARRHGIAQSLSSSLERIAEDQRAWFVDLFVRRGNRAAQELYRGMGYKVFKVIRGYYWGQMDGQDEDAYDMRKRCSRDKMGRHVRNDGEKHLVDAWDVV